MMSGALEPFASEVRLQQQLYRVEKQALLPSITMEWFNGTNSFAGADNYWGYQAGIALPLIFGGQKAKIRAAGIASQQAQSLHRNAELTLKMMQQQLLDETARYRLAIENYGKNGQQLASEIFKTARISFQQGEIDYFDMIQSLETATNIELNYLNNLNAYNQLVIEAYYLIQP